LVLLIRRTVRPRGYASSIGSPAALLDGLFEHLAEKFFSCPNIQAIEVLLCRNDLSAAY
jgi:hypothetical protein